MRQEQSPAQQRLDPYPQFIRHDPQPRLTVLRDRTSDRTTQTAACSTALVKVNESACPVASAGGPRHPDMKPACACTTS